MYGNGVPIYGVATALSASIVAVAGTTVLPAVALRIVTTVRLAAALATSDCASRSKVTVLRVSLPLKL